LSKNKAGLIEGQALLRSTLFTASINLIAASCVEVKIESRGSADAIEALEQINNRHNRYLNDMTFCKKNILIAG